MKKLNLLITSLLLVLLITACGNKFVAEVNIEQMDISRESLNLEFSVNDPKEQLSLGTLEGKLYYKETLINSYTPKRIDNDEEETLTYKITATNLSINHEYTIKIFAIADKRNHELLSETFKTKHEGSSESNPIYIHTVEEFMKMEDDNYAYYELVNDLDFAEHNFTPPFQRKTFQGSLNGNNKTIKNIMISQRATYIGIFGRNSGTIKDLNINNVNVFLVGTSQSSQYISILAARNSGVITNVNIENSTIKTNFSHSGVVRMGGISAYSESGSSITDSTVSINYDVQSISRSEYNIGGIVGELNGARLENSQATTKINIDNSTTAYIGGAVGQIRESTLNNSRVIKSEADLDLTIKTTVERVVSNSKTVAISIGGFAGRILASKITDAYAKAKINYKYAHNIVTNQSSSDKIAIGGFAGSVSNRSTLENVLAEIDLDLGEKHELIETSEHTVKFELGYNNDRLAEAEVSDGETVDEPGIPLREGYTFTGWYLGNELYDFDSIVEYSFSLVAQWEKDEGEQDKLTVLLDLGYGNNYLDTLEVNSGESINEPVTPQRNGHYFIGWYMNDEAYDFEAAVTNNLALEARWIKKSIDRIDLIYVGGIAGESYASEHDSNYALNPVINIYTNDGLYKVDPTVGSDNELGGFSNSKISVDDVLYENESFQLEDETIETKEMTEQAVEDFFSSEFINGILNR